MTSPKPSERLDFERDVPTTGADIRALRKHRPQAGPNWLEQVTKLAAQAPDAATELRHRATFADCVTFELASPAADSSVGD